MLNDDFLKKIVILRMNSKFMEHIRENYREVFDKALPFGTTVIKPDEKYGGFLNRRSWV